MGLLAKFNPKTRSNNNRSANPNSGPSTGGQNVSEAMFNLTGISGINYDFDSAKQGNFESYLNAVTPEQAQNAQKNAEKLKKRKRTTVKSSLPILVFSITYLRCTKLKQYTSAKG